MVQLCHFTSRFQFIDLCYDWITDVNVVKQGDDLDCHSDALVVLFKHVVGLGYDEKNLQEVLHVSCYLAQGHQDFQCTKAASIVVTVEEISCMNQSLCETMEIEFLGV